MASISFHRLARRELNDAASYYEIESSGLGAKFIDAVEACVAAIAEFPDAGANMVGQVQGESSPASRTASSIALYPMGFACSLS